MSMLPAYYEFICPVKILSGRKALSNLPYELNLLGMHKPMVVTDQGIVKAKLLTRVTAALKDADIDIACLYDRTPPDSSDRVVNEVAVLYREKGCDGLIAVGGGSAIDTAKGVNIVVSHQTDDLLKFQGVDRLTAALAPLVVIPTTAGTGSEVTNVSVIYNETTHSKMAFMSNKLYPHVALLDPVMTQTMPPKITAATGMDALTHAVEAFTGLQKNPVSDAFALAAVRLVTQYLVAAVKDGDDLDARLAMANAALLAGVAFSNSMVGVVHAHAHATGGVAHVPHGVANSILLPFGMDYNLDKSAADLAALAPAMGIMAPGAGEREVAMKVIAAVRQLKADLKALCGLPETLSEAGVTRENIPDIARKAMDDGSLTYNPTEMTYEESLKFLAGAL